MHGGAVEMIAVRARGGESYAVRNLLHLSSDVAELADFKHIWGLVESVLGIAAEPVRAILFDKTAGANWKVAWHQDLSIAVKEKR